MRRALTSVGTRVPQPLLCVVCPHELECLNELLSLLVQVTHRLQQQLLGFHWHCRFLLLHFQLETEGEMQKVLVLLSQRCDCIVLAQNSTCLVPLHNGGKQLTQTGQSVLCWRSDYHGLRNDRLLENTGPYWAHHWLGIQLCCFQLWFSDACGRVGPSTGVRTLRYLFLAHLRSTYSWTRLQVVDRLLQRLKLAFKSLHSL